MSDLRVDMTPDFRLPDPLPEFDAMLVAGGVAPGIDVSLRWLAGALGGRQRDRPVVLVPGTIEFCSDVPTAEALDSGRALAREFGLHLLNDETIRIGAQDRPGIQLVGSTLWIDWALDGAFSGRLARIAARHAWPSRERVCFRRGRSWSPIDAFAAHAGSRAYIEDVLTGIVHQATLGCAAPPNALVEGVRHGDRAVVLSCHAPSRRSLPEDWEGWFDDSWVAASRASDLESIMDQWGAPTLWVHGNVPRPVDYRVGCTRVVSNPRGDPSQPQGFVDDFLVRV